MSLSVCLSGGVSVCVGLSMCLSVVCLSVQPPDPLGEGFAAKHNATGGWATRAVNDRQQPTTHSLSLCVCVCVSLYACLYMYASVCACLCVCVPLCVCLCMCVSVWCEEREREEERKAAGDND